MPALQKRAMQNNILMTELLRLVLTKKGISPDTLRKKSANE